MHNLLDVLSKNLNGLDAKISYINIKINKLNKHLVYIYLLLLLNCLLDIIIIFK